MGKVQRTAPLGLLGAARPKLTAPQQAGSSLCFLAPLAVFHAAFHSSFLGALFGAFHGPFHD